MSEQTPPPSQSTSPSDPTSGLTAKRRRGARTGIIAAVAAAAVVAIGAIVWVNVANNGDPSATTDSAPAGDSEPGETEASGAYDLDAELSVGLTLEPDNLDIRTTAGAALDQILIDNVYEGLVTRDDDGTVAPLLASDWQLSDDGLTYTFTLNEGITFHSGNPLTVDDVLWSLTSVWQDEALRGHDAFTSVTSIEAPDQRTIEITLAAPNIDFLWSLTGRAGLVLEEAATNDLAVSANGTGPFQVPAGAWVQGDSVELTRYDDYWGEAAKLASIAFIYYGDSSALGNALQAGDIQIGQPGTEAAAGYQDSADWTVAETTSSSTGTIAFNSARAPFDDVRVRQALRLAFDKAALQEANNGLGQLIGGPIPPNDPGYEDLTDLFPYDPEEAKQLLAEAGYPDGFEATLTIPGFYGSTLPDLLTSAYAEIGVTLHVQSVEFAVWLEQVHTNADYDISYVLHAEARDLSNFAGRPSSSAELAAQGARYYFNYENPEVDALYQQSLAATTQEEQAELLRQAARIIAEDSPADWTSASAGLLVIRGDIEGYPVRDLAARFDATELAVAATS